MRFFRTSRPDWLDKRLCHEKVRALHSKSTQLHAYNWDDYVPPEDWLKQLASFFAEKLKKSDKNSKPYQDILKDLQRHANNERPIGRKISENLKIIFAILTQKKSPQDVGVNFDIKDESAVLGIVVRLEEGIENCSDGTLERTTMIRDEWCNPRNIAGFLTTYRKQLVEKQARKQFIPMYISQGQETHFVNHYLNVANDMGFSVPGAVFDYYYTKEHYPEKAKLKIKATALKDYCPIGMARHIEQEIQGIATSLVLEEIVRKESETPLEFEERLRDRENTNKQIADQIFRALEITPSEDHLQQLFSTKEIVITTAPPNKISCYTEINWVYVRKIIYEQLCQMGLIKEGLEKNKHSVLLPPVESNELVAYWVHCAIEAEKYEDEVGRYLAELERNKEREKIRDFLKSLCLVKGQNKKIFGLFKNRIGKKNNQGSVQSDKVVRGKIFKSLYYQIKDVKSVNDEIKLYLLSLHYAPDSKKCKIVQKDIKEFFSLHYRLDGHDSIESAVVNKAVDALLQGLKAIEDTDVRENIIRLLVSSEVLDVLQYHSPLIVVKLINITTVSFASSFLKERFNSKTALLNYKRDTSEKKCESIHAFDELSYFIDVLNELTDTKIRQEFFRSEYHKVAFQRFTDLLKALNKPVSEKQASKIMQIFQLAGDPYKPILLNHFHDCGVLKKIIIGTYQLSKFIAYLKDDDLNKLIEGDRTPGEFWGATKESITQSELLSLWNALRTYQNRFLYLQKLKDKNVRLFVQISEKLLCTLEGSIVIKRMNLDPNEPKEEKVYADKLFKLLGGYKKFLEGHNKIGKGLYGRGIDIFLIVIMVRALPGDSESLVKIDSQKFVDFIFNEVSKEKQPNVITELLSVLSDNAKDEFFKVNNCYARLAKYILEQNEFVGFLPNILEQLNEEQSDLLVKALVSKYFSIYAGFAHFTNPEKFIVLFQGLSRKARESLLAFYQCRNLYKAFLVGQKIKFLSLLNDDEKKLFIESWDDQFKNEFLGVTDQEHARLILQSMSKTQLKNLSEELLSLVQSNCLSLPELFQLLHDHRPSLVFNDLVEIFGLNTSEQEQGVINALIIKLINKEVCDIEDLDKTIDALLKFPVAINDDGEKLLRGDEERINLHAKLLVSLFGLNAAVPSDVLVKVLSCIKNQEVREVVVTQCFSVRGGAINLGFIQEKVTKENFYKLLPLLEKSIAEKLVLLMHDKIKAWLSELNHSWSHDTCSALLVVLEYIDKSKRKAFIHDCGGLDQMAVLSRRDSDIYKLLRLLSLEDYSPEASITTVVSHAEGNKNKFFKFLSEVPNHHFSLVFRSLLKHEIFSYFETVSDLVAYLKVEGLTRSRQKWLFHNDRDLKDNNERILYRHLRSMLSKTSDDELITVIEACNDGDTKRMVLNLARDGLREVHSLSQLQQLTAPFMLGLPKDQCLRDYYLNKSEGKVKAFTDDIAHFASPRDKDQHICRIGLDELASWVRDVSDLELLVESFPEDPLEYNLALLSEIPEADRFNYACYQKNKIYLFLGDYEFGGKDKTQSCYLGYVMVSANGQSLLSGDLGDYLSKATSDEGQRLESLFDDIMYCGASELEAKARYRDEALQWVNKSFCSAVKQELGAVLDCIADNDDLIHANRSKLLDLLERSKPQVFKDYRQLKCAVIARPPVRGQRFFSACASSVEQGHGQLAPSVSIGPT